MKLNFKRLELQLTHTWTIARGTGENICKTVVVELTGADGTVGLGEAAPITRYKETIDTVQAFLKKVDARGLSFNDVEGSMTYLDTLSPHDMSAKCALNLALLDGAAKRARKAVYDFLELGFRENHHVTSFSIGIDKPEMIRKKENSVLRLNPKNVIPLSLFQVKRQWYLNPHSSTTLKA